MAKLHHLKFNDLAPDLELVNPEGEPVKLSSQWKEQVLVLASTRYFGCPQCKEKTDHLVSSLPEFKKNDFDHPPGELLLHGVLAVDRKSNPDGSCI